MNTCTRYLFHQSSLLLKALLVFLFLSCVLIRYSQKPDSSNCSFFRAAVESINKGYPFHHLDLSGKPIPYHKQLIDSGMRFALSSVASLFSLWPYLKDYHFKESDIRYISAFIFVLINLGLISIRLPNLFLILSQLSIWLAIFYIDHSLFWGDSNLRGIDGLAPVILAIFTAFLIFDDPRSKQVGACILFGLICGTLPLFRQTASFIFQSSFLMICISALLVGRSKMIGKLALTTASFLFVRLGIILICSLVFLHKGSLEPTIQHGSGQPLFCGLGFTENPYNIAWEDDNANVNHMLIYDRVEEQNTRWADDLGKIFKDIVIQDPLLVLKNSFKKCVALNSYIFSAKLNSENDCDIVAVSPKKMHLIVYVVSMLSVLGMLLYLFSRKTLKKNSVFVFLAMIAILIASSAGPLLVFPGYYASFIGLLYSLVFLLIPLFIVLECGIYPSELIDVEIIRNRAMISGLIISMAIGSYVLYRSIKNNRESHSLLSDSNPIQKIENMGYKYGYLFNRLTKVNQEKIIASILRNGTGVWRFAKGSDLFSPVCVIFNHPTGKKFAEAHLIAYLSDRRIPPLPKADQGPGNSYILLSKGDREFISYQFVYDASSCVYNRITDGNWNGKYTFISFPVTDAFIQDLRGLSVSAWNMIADRSTNHFGHEMISRHPLQP